MVPAPLYDPMQGSDQARNRKSCLCRFWDYNFIRRVTDYLPDVFTTFQRERVAVYFQTHIDCPFVRFAATRTGLIARRRFEGT